MIAKEVFSVSSIDPEQLVAVYQNESLVLETPNVIEYLDDAGHGLSSLAQYRLANTSPLPIAVQRVNSGDHFSTTIKLRSVFRPSWWQGYPSSYPFDKVRP
jgi:hypothetical protein